jgi:hypothetical protein
MKIILSFSDVYLPFFSDMHKMTTQNQPKQQPDYFIFNIVTHHNTYVYDANIKAGIIDSSQPINAYRIVYTKNGIKNLSRLQKN